MKRKDVRGTTVSLKEIKEGKILYKEYTPKAEYRWDCGVGVGRYLEELKNGKLIGKKCNKCKRIMIPPRMFCEKCFRPTDEWVYLKDTGTIRTFSLCYVNWDASRREEPIIPAVILIDGASEGMGIMHLISEVDPKKVKIGMKVKAVWKEGKEREGAITDIKYFKPISEI